MRRYLLQLIALLVVAVAGSVIFWRVGTSHTATSPTTPALAASAPTATASAKSATPTSGAASAPLVSWPKPTTQYLGRYRLTSSSDTSIAKTGELTIFMRFNVPHEPKPVLSGILNLDSDSESNVLYLTHFMHAGPKLWTRVNLGIYTGPMIGQFVVTARQGTKLTAQLDQQGSAPIVLRFVHFTTNPHP